MGKSVPHELHPALLSADVKLLGDRRLMANRHRVLVLIGPDSSAHYERFVAGAMSGNQAPIVLKLKGGI